ncbi:uncharacterized protein METZ01_LOCUS344755, partial [marine metagenome]
QNRNLIFLKFVMNIAFLSLQSLIF